MPNQTLSMDMKPCVVCKTPVDVDNGFGHVSDEEVYCVKHAELGKIWEEFNNARKSIEISKKIATKLQNLYNEAYAKIEGKECTFIRRDMTLMGYVQECRQREPKGKKLGSTKLVIVTKLMEQNDFSDLCCQIGGRAPEVEITFHIKTDKKILEKRQVSRKQ